jgi:hypothetical protein
MEVLVFLLQAYLLCWVPLIVYGMLAVVYLDVRACLCDLASCVRSKWR